MSDAAAFAGPAACLLAAALWAGSVELFRPLIERHGARTVNLVKCNLAALLQGVTIFALGQAGGLWTAPPRSLMFVAASGVVGLVIGDTALFGAVARIGVHRTLLLQTLAPIFTALLALAWRGERPGGLQAVGAGMILGGVAIVVAPRGAGAAATLRGTGAPSAPGQDGALAGMLLAVGAALGQGAGIVLAKEGMTDLPVAAASFLRLLSAAVGLVVVAAVAGRLGRVGALLRSRPDVRRVVPATMLGTYVAIFLMMAGVALAPAAIAAVLLATSPVFSLVLEALVHRRPIPPAGLAGTLLAVAGVALLSAGG